HSIPRLLTFRTTPFLQRLPTTNAWLGAISAHLLRSHEAAGSESRTIRNATCQSQPHAAPSKSAGSSISCGAIQEPPIRRDWRLPSVAPILAKLKTGMRTSDG